MSTTRRRNRFGRKFDKNRKQKREKRNTEDTEKNLRAQRKHAEGDCDAILNVILRVGSA